MIAQLPRRALTTLTAGLLLVSCATGRDATRSPAGEPDPTVSSASAQTPDPSSPSAAASSSREVSTSIATRRGTVTRVVDGDTAVVSIADIEEKVRFIGINTPESTTRHEPYGAEASAYTKKALAGKVVWLETDAELRDRYGRVLAYVWLAQPRVGDEAEVRRSMFNARLLLDGYAQVATYPPNVKYVDSFLAFQREAREASKGLWGLETSAEGGSASGGGASQVGGKCDPSYPDVCIAPPPPDLDCGDISYRRFRVIGADPHRFDGDRDGIGCES